MATRLNWSATLHLAILYSKAEFKQQVEEEMDKVAMTYHTFKEIQLHQHEDMVSFKIAKHELVNRLRELNNVLNQKMYSSNNIVSSSHGGSTYEQWLSSYQPFHWIAEFYQIIQGNKGFDVIIGNPPYVQLTEIQYKLKGFDCIKCGDLYALCVERVSTTLLKEKHGKIGMIVPISISSTDGYGVLRTLLTKIFNGLYLSNFGVRPSKLFDGVDKRLTIFMSSENNAIHCTKYYRWNTTERNNLFKIINYCPIYQDTLNISGFPKISSFVEANILDKISHKKNLNYYVLKSSSIRLQYTRKLQYFIQFFIDPPIIYNNKHETLTPSELKKLCFDNKEERDLVISFLNSSLFFWFFITFSDCRNVNAREILHFPTDLRDCKDKTELIYLAYRILENFKDNSIFLTRNDKRADILNIQSFKPRLSKPIIDDIDKLLAKHYGFTEEELDFIINYDIKYRMGDELNDEEEE